MCYKVESPFILIHYLRTKSSCTIREIVAVKRKIENEIPSVYVDVSKNSILQTVSFYPEIFSWEGDSVTTKQTASPYFETDVIDFFSNTNIDKSLETKIIHCILS